MPTPLLAAALTAPAALPADEERLELESLAGVRLEAQAVPAWPDMRPFRRPARDAPLVGLAIAAVSGVLVASVIPDRATLLERRYLTLTPCERKQAAGLSIGCI